MKYCTFLLYFLFAQSYSGQFLPLPLINTQWVNHNINGNIYLALRCLICAELTICHQCDNRQIHQKPVNCIQNIVRGNANHHY